MATTSQGTATIQEIETVSLEGETNDIRSFELSVTFQGDDNNSGDEPCHSTTTTKVHVCSLGASILKLLVQDNDNDEELSFHDVVLGYPTGTDMYSSRNPYYFQAVVGRVANRIQHGKFSLRNEETNLTHDYQLEINNPPNHLHGGVKGFSHRVWKVEKTGIVHHDAWCQIPYVQFTLDSENGDQGYPGHVLISATYSLRPSIRSRTECTLRLELRAHLKPGEQLCTPINLAQHSYFNLAPNDVAAVDGILSHSIQLESDAYTPVDCHSIPTKDILPIQDHPVMDLSSEPRLLKDVLRSVGIREMNLPATQVDDELNSRQSKTPYGIDHNFVVRRQPAVPLPKVATLAWNTRTLNVYSTVPGVQVYTANYLGGNSGSIDSENSSVGDATTATSQQKHEYRRWSGICLETQHFPDSIKHARNTLGTGGFAVGKCPILTSREPDYEHVVEYGIDFHSSHFSEKIGSDTSGRTFTSIEEMWGAQDLKSWYRRSSDYYEENCPSTVDGVLGGLGELSDIDLAGSRDFLLKNLGLSLSSSVGTACECGAGIGRVTKGLLLDFCQRCDVVESCSRLVTAAPDYIGHESNRCRFFCTELQHWQPQQGKYSK